MDDLAQLLSGGPGDSSPGLMTGYLTRPEQWMNPREVVVVFPSESVSVDAMLLLI